MTSQAGYTQLNSGTVTFQIRSPTLIEGNLEKLSHDFFVKKWQTRRFELDIPKKTLKYFLGDELKDEYSELSKIENIHAVSRDRPHRFVVYGKSSKSKDDNVSELHINSDSDVVKKKWMEAIQQSISGVTSIDVEGKGTFEKSIIESTQTDIENVGRVTEFTNAEVEIEKVGGNSYLVLYLENLNLISQLLGIYTTYLLLIHLMPNSTEGPSSCGNTFFIYENPVTGICVGTELGVIIVAIHLMIDVVFASIISNGIDFKKKVLDFEIDIMYLYNGFGQNALLNFITWQLTLYASMFLFLYGFPSLTNLFVEGISSLTNLFVIFFSELSRPFLYLFSSLERFFVVVGTAPISFLHVFISPDDFRGMLLSTFGMQPWILRGVESVSGISLRGGYDHNFCTYFLVVEGLAACLYYLLVTFANINQILLLLCSIGAFCGAIMFQLIKDMNDIYIPTFIISNVVFFLSTTLPISWYTISVIYLFGALLLCSLLTEVFRIFTDGTMENILGFLVIFGFPGVGAIAIVNLLISWLYNIFDGTSNGAATTDDATATSLRSLLSSSNEDYNAPSVSAIFDDTCYLGVSMLFVLSTVVTLCRLSIWEDSAAYIWDVGRFFLGPFVAVFLYVAFFLNWDITETLEPYNDIFTVVICAIVYFVTPIFIQSVFLPIFNCTINSCMIMVNPKEYLEPNEVPLERFVANVSDDQNILDKDSVTFWVTLNMCNFFFENVTEAIICGCLLFSGYNDIFLTMFAVPTIVNTSVRLCKVLVPLLVYTVCPFLWDCLVAFVGFLYDCFAALVGYVMSCFNFVLSDRRASAGERQHLELSNAYDGNDNNDNKSFRVLIHRIEVTNASQADASRSNNLSCNVKYLGFTLSTETRRDCGASAAWDIKKSNANEVSLMDNDKVKCSVEVWDMNASGENSFMIGKADIDIKSMFDKSNLYSTMKFRFKASNTDGKHSADVVLSMEASK